MEAQLRTDPLIQSGENQHASGTKNWLNLLTLFSGERTHALSQHKTKRGDTCLQIYSTLAYTAHARKHKITLCVMYQVLAFSNSLPA